MDRLLVQMFDYDRWVRLLDRASEKGIPEKSFRELFNPEARRKLFDYIASGKYEIDPPKIARIPKDNPGEYREVYVNNDLDRIVLALINDSLFDMFPHFQHENCVSYRKNSGTQKTVQAVSGKITAMTADGNPREIGWKIDFSKYFDNVALWAIEDVFNRIEDELGFERGTEPVLNILRGYYHNDVYYDNHGNKFERYQGLKQGCAVASFLANAVLYELDDVMSKKYPIYYRYSDDAVIIGESTDSAIEEINAIISRYGVGLNPEKVERLRSDRWFKFLGFLIKRDQITLSRKRVKKFQKEIEDRTIKRKDRNWERAMKDVYQYLYGGDHPWAYSCLGTINVEKDINELNKFLMDAIRACRTGRRKIGGLGTSLGYEDQTVVRGKGRSVSENRRKFPKIDGYITIGCCARNLKISKKVFRATVNNLL